MDALDRLSAEPALAALFLDVDGTLAPIVADPDDSRVPDGTRGELARLAASYGLVACVTGRTADVAAAIVGVPELTYVGEHGLELDPDAGDWASRIRTFATLVDWPAELKPLSAAFHYRTAPDREAARLKLEEVAAGAEQSGLKTRWGRLVLEVLPPLEVNKGTAVRYLLAQRGLGRALYAGDDTTDLDGFAALDGLEVAVRVGVVSPESPGPLRDRADVVVDSPEALTELLTRL